MPRLIINADDLGVNAQRSHGIFLCAEQGIVTSASLVPNGTDSDLAARHARERELPTGLHLSLTDGPPLSKPDDVRSLLSREDSFHDQHTLRRMIGEGHIEAVHVEREIRAQVEWFLDHRGAPTHVSSHRHMHMHPFIVPLLIPILLRYGIGSVRIPSELLPPFGFEIEQERLSAAQAVSTEADAARPLFEANGIAGTQHFRGLALVGHASAKNLRHIIARLPDGTTELMVHPGSPTPLGTDFDRDPQRQTELRMLLDPAVRPLLASRKIELCSFADLL